MITQVKAYEYTAIKTYESPWVAGKIELIHNEAGKYHIVQETFIVKTRYGKEVKVPQKFKTDFYTFVPDLKHSKYAAVVHDWLYSTHEFADGTPCTRAQADKIFYDLIRTSPDKNYAELYYVGVRVTANFAWIKGKKKGPRYG